MPSDAKKARDAAKKAAAKQQKVNRGKKVDVKEEAVADNVQTNGYAEEKVADLNGHAPTDAIDAVDGMLLLPAKCSFCSVVGWQWRKSFLQISRFHDEFAHQ